MGLLRERGYSFGDRAIVASMRRCSFVCSSSTVVQTMWLKWFVSKWMADPDLLVPRRRP
jgi:hypothetical protein